LRRAGGVGAASSRSTIGSGPPAGSGGCQVPPWLTIRSSRPVHEGRSLPMGLLPPPAIGAGEQSPVRVIVTYPHPTCEWLSPVPTD
jgi:hypothetical protein